MKVKCPKCKSEKVFMLYNETLTCAIANFDEKIDYLEQGEITDGYDYYLHEIFCEECEYIWGNEADFIKELKNEFPI